MPYKDREKRLQFLREYSKTHRKPSTPETLETRRSRYLQNIDTSRAYYQRNRERISEVSKQYRQANSEKIAEKSRKWMENNRGKWNAKANRYRAAKLQAIPKWTTKEQFKEIEQFYIGCPKYYHVDHIYPLQGIGSSGLHVLWNLQYLPAKENIAKGNRMPKGT